MHDTKQVANKNNLLAEYGTLAIAAKVKSTVLSF